jgi:hypothetical protein
MALRLAPHVARAPQIYVGPAAEAAVAWWHAYEARRRRRQLAVLIAVLVLVVVAVRASNDRTSTAAPLVPAWPVPVHAATASWTPQHGHSTPGELYWADRTSTTNRRGPVGEPLEEVSP